MFEDKEYLSVLHRREVKIVHCLIPDGELCTGYIPSLGPRVRFAFDQRGRSLGAKIKPVPFLPGANTDWNDKIALQSYALTAKESPGKLLEIVSGVRVAHCAKTLKVVRVHR